MLAWFLPLVFSGQATSGDNTVRLSPTLTDLGLLPLGTVYDFDLRADYDLCADGPITIHNVWVNHLEGFGFAPDPVNVELKAGSLGPPTTRV